MTYAHILPFRFFQKYTNATITIPARTAATVKPAVVIARDEPPGCGLLPGNLECL